MFKIFAHKYIHTMAYTPLMCMRNARRLSTSSQFSGKQESTQEPIRHDTAVQMFE
jgi:hypothetical protein